MYILYEYAVLVVVINSVESLLQLAVVHKNIMSPILNHKSASGFWGQPTATLDWCEQNYEVRCSKRNYVINV